jgi:hypothetical protein
MNTGVDQFLVMNPKRILVDMKEKPAMRTKYPL